MRAFGSHPGHDGVFENGPFAGKSVNVKTYSRHESVLDISSHPCDYSRVLTGPPGQARILPWVIDSVLLFDQEQLLGKLRARGVKIARLPACGRRTGKQHGSSHLTSPRAASQLTDRQIAWLSLFSPTPAA
jgi:hypothetical protein